MTMQKDSKNLSTRDKILSNQYYKDNLYAERGSMPFQTEFPSCCGLHVITGILPLLSYGNGRQKFDPIERNLQRFGARGIPLKPEEQRPATEEYIKKDKTKSLKEIKYALADIGNAPAGSLCAVTHAQFIMIGKDLYDLGFVAIVNNSMSTKHFNRIILLYRESEHAGFNEHETFKGFTYEEVMAAIAKYKLM